MKYLLLQYVNEIAMLSLPREEAGQMHAAYMAYTEAMKGRRPWLPASKFGFACATLRCGMFYGPESAHVVAFRRLLRWRLLPVFRHCDALKAFIHIEDAAAAFAAAVRSGSSGLWHAVDDRPVSMNEFVRTLARCCGSPPSFELPHGLTRLLGDVARSPFLEATVTSNQKLRADLGWSPRFPTIESGFASIVAEWAERSNLSINADTLAAGCASCRRRLRNCSAPALR